MNAQEYRGGDPVLLTYTVTRTGPGTSAHLYLFLEVFGQFFFYPSWGSAVDHAFLSVSANSEKSKDVLDFTLPRPLSAGGPFVFYAALTLPGTYDLMSNVAIWSFAFVE